MPNRLRALWRGGTGTVLRAALAILPLAWLATRVDLAGATRLLGAHSLPPLALAYGVALLSIWLGAVRWGQLMRGYGAEELPGVWSRFRHLMVAIYFSVLPSGMAGEAMRGYQLRAGMQLAVSYTVVLLDRISGMVGLLIITALGCLLTPTHGSRWPLTILTYGALTAVLIAGPLLALPVLRDRWHPLGRLASRLPLLRRLQPMSAPLRLVPAVAISVLVHALATAAHLPLLQAVVPAVPVSAALSVLPAILLLSHLPLTPAGIGQRELIFTLLLGQIRVAPEASIAVSVLTFALYLLCVALGGLLHLAQQLAGSRLTQRGRW